MIGKAAVRDKKFFEFGVIVIANQAFDIIIYATFWQETKNTHVVPLVYS